MRDRRSLRTGSVWALALVVMALLLPRPGGWTIDDGVKRIAATVGQGFWAEQIPDGPVRASLDDPAAFPSLDPPFAVHTAGGFRTGFSPLTRAWFHLFEGHDVALRLAIALAVILLWALLEANGFALAFLLLPLTFYGLTPWEHGWSWLLLWPLLWITLVRPTTKSIWHFAAGLTAAPAAIMRPETGVLVIVMIGYLLYRKQYRSLLLMFCGGALALASHALLHAVTGSEPLLAQVQLNLTRIHSASVWLHGRGDAFYALFLRMDEQPGVSWALLAAFGLGAALLGWHERKPRRAFLVAGMILLAAWTAALQYRLWSHPLPPYIIMFGNSLFTALPWTAVLLRPPYRGRVALLLAMICAVIVALVTPVWNGVHWGPRLLLFAAPLLIIDLYQTKRARGWMFAALVGVTAVQTLSSAVLVYARDQELADRHERLSQKLGNVVVCSHSTECADLAPLWLGREFFTANDRRALRQLLIQFRKHGVDTCWLHLPAQDRLYVETFPEAKPVWPHRMTVLNAGTLYKTQWRVYELVVNAKDSSWAGVLQAEAGALLRENRLEEALALQQEAVKITPDSADVHHNLALILSSLGQQEEARTEVARALELDEELTAAQRLREELNRQRSRTGASAEPPADPGPR